MSDARSTLRWGIRDSFISYIERAWPHQITGQRAEDDGAFVFHEVSDDGHGSIGFRGVIDISAHGGMLRLVLADPVLRISDDGLGVLDFAYGASKSLFTLLALSRRDRDTWSAELTADGSSVFDSAYPAGAPMSDVIVDVQTPNTAAIRSTSL